MTTVHMGPDIFDGPAFCGSSDGPFIEAENSADLAGVIRFAEGFTERGVPIEVCRECSAHVLLLDLLNPPEVEEEA